MSAWEHVQAARAAVAALGGPRPTVGVVLGSGLGAFTEKLAQAQCLSYADIPHMAPSHIPGHAGELCIGQVGDSACAVLSGRVHAYEGHPPDQVVFGVRLLAALGVKALVVTNAAGGVNPHFDPGDLMVICDHLNLTFDNPLRGANDSRFGPRFPDMSQAYAPGGRAAWHAAARRCGLSLREGVYAGLLGPAYETPAEVRMLHRLGADAVGMSTVHEVIAARHMGLTVAGLSVITNRAAGLSATPLSHQEVTEIASRVRGSLCDLLAEMVAAFAAPGAA